LTTRAVNSTVLQHWYNNSQRQGIATREKLLCLTIVLVKVL